MGNQIGKGKVPTELEKDAGTLPTVDSNDLISFCSFGEATTVPIEIRKAVFNATDPVPFLHRFLASLELTVVNTIARNGTSGRFRITLPVGTTVKKFEVLRREESSSPRWYPAVAVPKKKAKEVVYKEKEKGRDVAAVSDVASGSNVFEIEVSPLPFGEEVKCRLECIITGELEDFQELASGYFPNGKTEVVVNTPAKTKQAEDHNLAGMVGVGGAVVGESFDKTHFICRVPPLDDQISGLAAEGKCCINPINRIAVVWDTSASMSKASSLFQNRYKCLRELAEKCNQHAATPVTFELYSFSVGAAVREGVFGNIDELISTIKAFEYDGGTDIMALTDLFLQLSQRQHGAGSVDVAGIDSVLVFTDGMDNLGGTPHFEVDIPFPVHVIADVDEVNLRCARALASASPEHPGCIFTRKDDSYVPGVLYKRAILQSIKTDQSEGAFTEEFDDGFRIVPDHRLQCLNEPIGSDGLIISGILGEKETRTVTKVTAVVSFGDETHEFTFQLRNGLKDATNKRVKKAQDLKSTQTHHYEAVRLFLAKDAVHNSSKPIDPARILGYVYAEEVYRAAESFGFKSGFDMKSVREDLSVEYGFCSPESSLLMLYRIEQFRENNVIPPRDHPAYDDEKAVEERKNRDEERKSTAGDEGKEMQIAEGEIGGLKNDYQKGEVLRLAKELDTYLSEPVVLKKETLRERGRAVSGESERMLLMSAERLGALESCAGSVQQSLADAAPRQGGGRLLRLARSVQRRAARARDCDPPAATYDACFSAAPRSMITTVASPMVMACAAPAPRAATRAAAGGHSRAMCMTRGWEEEEADDSAADAGSSGMGPICMDHSSVAPPKDPESYAKNIEEALKNAECQDNAWKNSYHLEKEQLREDGAVSPSFFLACARLALKYSRSLDAIRIATNCLEAEIEDVQMLRCVAYFLLSTKRSEGTELALRVFDKVQELQPCEPQSFLDSALARFWKLSSRERNGPVSKSEKAELEKSVLVIQDLVARVLTHKWADRFDEIEWPALILLHYVADFVKGINEQLHTKGTKDALPEWPASKLSCFRSKAASTADQDDALRCSKFDLALMVWMGWDSDHTDVDLHILEPTKNEVYYGNKNSTVGGHLSRDFTNGYGPEVYILKRPADCKGKGCEGNYDIYAKYYASHQDSPLTGATSVLLWTVEKKRDGAGNEIEFLNVRLDTHKEKTKVKSFQLVDV